MPAAQTRGEAALSLDLRRAAVNRRLFRLRRSEILLLAYFLFALTSSYFRGGHEVWPIRAAAVLTGGCVLFALAAVEARTGSLAAGCARDWLPAALILAAYWTADWMGATPGGSGFEASWIGLDRKLLYGWGGKAAVESLGPVIPFALEFCYSFLYAVAPLSLGYLYLRRQRRRVDIFLSVLLLGVLAADALMPQFPSLAPRIAVPGEDLQAYLTPFRRLNLWLLGNWDVRCSVFPSGHVTLGFSAAFGLLLALPERRRAGLALLVVACAVFAATVYGRYHFAVDGLAGIAVSVVTSGIAWLALFGAGRRARP